MNTDALKNNYTGNHAIFVADDKGTFFYVPSTTCTGNFASSYSNKKTVAIKFLIKDNDKNKEVKKDFVRWVTGTDSVYSPLFNFFGDRMTRFDENTIIFDGDCNMKVLVNFFKSARTITEHSSRLDFWKKWKIDKGKDPRLTYLLMYAYNINGQRNFSGHAPIEGHVLTEVDLKKFLNNGEDHWGLSSMLRIKNNANFNGENKLMWGGGETNIMEIPAKDYREIPSYFYKLYNKKIPNQLSDDDFEAFYERNKG